jgi:hypothetical protein
VGCGGRTAADLAVGEGGHGAATAAGAAGGGGTAPEDPMPPGDDLVDVTGVSLDLPPSCGGLTATYDFSPLALELVVDLSGTMSEGANWTEARAELRLALGALSVPAEVGLSFFPNMPTPSNPRDPAGACMDSTHDVPRRWFDDAQRRALDGALLAASPLGGAGAPIHDAYLAALGRLQSGGTPIVLLVTNGFPTYQVGCVGTGSVFDVVDPDPIVDSIRAAGDLRMPTFVIGAPGSGHDRFTGEDARPWLSGAARAGRTARSDCSDAGPRYCHLDMTTEPDFSTTLNRALERIYYGPPDCVFLLSLRQPVAPNGVTVTFVGRDDRAYLVRHNEFEPCQRGWHFVAGRDLAEVELCPETCQRFGQMFQGDVSIRVACGAVGAGATGQ